MKKTISLWVLLSFTITVKSQYTCYNMSLTLLPSSPTTTDIVKVECTALMSSAACPFVSSTITSNNFQITATAYHNIGVAAALCPSTVTLVLGNYAAGSYKLIYRIFETTSNSFVCKDSLNFIITAAAVGVNENYSKENVIKIYPNPADESIKIEVTNGTVIKTIKLYDLTGKLIKSFSSTETPLNIEDIVQGRYLLKIITNKGSYSENIIKQ